MASQSESEWVRLQRLFRGACALSVGQRDSYLRENCEDPAIRAEVVGLVEALEASDSLLGTPLVSKPERAFLDPAPQIEGFSIGKKLGEGGMGVVYEAEQNHPRRRVALKVLRPGLLSSSNLKRFEREAHLLGRLQHAGIAQIYEAGVADSANGPVPFFAMEHVKGLGLRDYAQARELSLEARLELIASVGDAVHHAHQRGVIHRDLKPANILVTTEGNIKVLDFGVARNTDIDLQLTTMRTDVGQLIGTLAYMSPEQTTGNPDLLDTRSDVYAMGVVAYELLAGRLPYDIRSAMLPEAVRVIQDEQPAALRTVNPACRGDVETIIGKALEKDPERRYSSASEMAADLRRYLAHEPIEARPASRLYQLRRFGQRNRGLALSALSLLFVLVLAVVVSTKLAFDRTQALARAEASNVAARQGEATALAVRRFLEVDLLGQASPFVHADRDLTLAQALDNAARALDGRFPQEPEVERSLRMTLAKTLGDLSRYGEAHGQALRARELAQSLHGVESFEWRLGERLLGQIESEQGNYQGASERLERLLERETLALPVDHPERIATLGVLGDVLHRLGNQERAADCLGQALELAAGVPAISQQLRWDFKRNLGATRSSQGRLDEARELLEGVFADQQAVLGPDYPATLDTGNCLAIVLKDAGQFEEAVRRCNELLPPCERVLGARHVSTLSLKTVLAGALHNLGRFQDSLTLLMGNLVDFELALGSSSVEVWKTRGQIADTLLRLGRVDEAKEYAVQAMAGLEEAVGRSHYFTLLAYGRMGNVHEAEGQMQMAIEMHEAALELSEEIFGLDHTQTATQLHNLGSVFESLGELEEASGFYAQAVEINSEQLGAQDPRVLTTLGSLAGIQLRSGRLEEAERLYTQVIDGFEVSVGLGYWIRGSALQDYSECLRRMNRIDSAVEAANEAAAIMRATFGPEHARTQSADEHYRRVRALSN